MKMHKKILSALISAGVIGFTTYGVNTMAASTTGNAAADIVTALTITAGTTMNFGDLSVGAGGGTAVLTTASTVSSTGDVVVQGGTVAAGTFTLGGANSAGYAITMPASITVASGGPTMTIATYTFLAEDTATDSTGTLSGAGAGTMTIGGTLTVGGSQAAGAYAGTYTITALYE